MPSPYGDCEPSEDYVRTKCLAKCEADYVISNCSCKDISMLGEKMKMIYVYFPFSCKFRPTVYFKMFKK